jgi:hypothetical protein
LSNKENLHCLWKETVTFVKHFRDLAYHLKQKIFISKINIYSMKTFSTLLISILFSSFAFSQNVIDFDADSTWISYMNVRELPANGGAYAFGSFWAVADAKSTLDANTGANGTLTLQPNFNAYADSPMDAFWVNQSTGLGNKEMEASTFVEPGPTLLGADFTFTGNVMSHTIDTSLYTVKMFVKALDPNNGYGDALFDTKVFDLPMSGNFSITVDATDLTAGLIIQYGFSVTGINANPTDEATLGSVVIGAMATNVNKIEAQPSLVAVYPNPVNDILTVSTNENIEAFKIVDVAGKVVLEGNNINTVDVSALNAGTYFIEFTLADRREVDTFVKK